jgi:transcription-repair coupling factor (superfamily II helicase)
VIKIDLDPGRPGRLLVAGAPEGHDARVLADLAKRRGAGGVLHIALDDGCRPTAKSSAGASMR